jgi:lysozyme
MNTFLPEGWDILKTSESCELQAYMDPGGVWTIGWGNTHYMDGSPVKPGDTLTQDQADKLLEQSVPGYEEPVRQLVTSNINNFQYSALVDFTYNEGPQRLLTSTLLKKVNANPEDPTIRDEFMKWVYDNGQKLSGLVLRREKEADLYFKKKLKSVGSSHLSQLPQSQRTCSSPVKNDLA